jgi:hypothetical protein
MSPTPKTLEARAGVRIERVLDRRAARRRGPGRLGELPDELFRAHLAGLLPGRAAEGPVGRNHPHFLAVAVLGRQTLHEGVGRGRKPHLERAVDRVLAEAVEDDDAARAVQRDVARQGVHELASVGERPRVQDVVAVEEVEHTLRMPGVQEETAYLAELVARLRKLLGSGLLGVYAGGSWALGGYEPGRSDLDVTAVTHGAVPRQRLSAVADRLRHESFPCPARGLELVVYPLAAVSVPTVDPGFLLNLNTGAGLAFRTDFEPAEGERHWFAIDRSVLAQHGLALFGPPAANIFSPPSRSDLLPLLAETLRWYLREAPGDESGILNACRALTFARQGVWLAKPAVRAEAWAALAERGGPEELLRSAIEELEASYPERAEGEERGNTGEDQDAHPEPSGPGHGSDQRRPR